MSFSELFKNAVILDFESEAIEPRPKYPPKPVGVSLDWRSENGKRKCHYFAWAHPTENNCTFKDAKRALKDLWRKKVPIVMHNAKFDLEILKEFFGIDYSKRMDLVHCTQILAYLYNPYFKTFSLKPLSEQLFNLPPDEQDDVRDWILENVKGASISRQSDHYWAKYICLAPGGLVGKYANGDTKRTWKLFKYLLPSVIGKYKMQEPCSRELALIPCMWQIEERGVNISKNLPEDIKQVQENLELLEKAILKRAKAPKGVEVGTQDFADALLASGKVSGFVYTDKGNRSVSKDNLAKVITDERLQHMLIVRSKMATNLKTFMLPWYERSKDTGILHTNWNSTRTSGAREMGARTGRLSSNPNFQNVPKEVEIPDNIVKYKWARDLYSLIPAMRKYIVPPENQVIVVRDYSQQELRVLGHFEDGVLMEAFKEDLSLDMHDYAKTLVNQMLNANYSRKPIKTIGFGLLYGMGLAALAERLGEEIDEAKRLKNAYLDCFPGLKEMQKELMALESEDDFMRTWGGRVYYTEPPKIIKGRLRHFGYKLFNYLIQGSSADVTKEAIIRAIAAGLDLRLTVHDELFVYAERRHMIDAMEALKEVMESIELDVPMLSDGKFGFEDWANLTTYDTISNGVVYRGVA